MSRGCYEMKSETLAAVEFDEHVSQIRRGIVTTELLLWRDPPRVFLPLGEAVVQTL